MDIEKSAGDGLRFGLVGAGDIGRLRAAALVAGSGHRLIAVTDSDAGRAKEVAQVAGAATERDLAGLLARDDVDALIVSTPPALHRDMAIRALEAGKHVLCEKPLARDPAECRAMVDAAETAGLLLATGFNYRFYPSFALARELLDSGAIGELSHIRSYGGYSATSHNQPWVHDGGVVGGGALHDIGIHLIDLTRDFLGDVDEVVRFSSGTVWNFPGCEDNGFLLMRSRKGSIATLHASWTEWDRYRFVVELVGNRGTIRASCFPMKLELISMSEPGARAQRRTYRFPRYFLGEHLKSYRWVVVRSFVEEHDAFAAAVRGAPSRIATGTDGLTAIEIAYGHRLVSTEHTGSAAAISVSGD